jgi:hypothetical protein
MQFQKQHLMQIQQKHRRRMIHLSQMIYNLQRHHHRHHQIHHRHHQQQQHIELNME